MPVQDGLPFGRLDGDVGEKIVRDLASMRMVPWGVRYGNTPGRAMVTRARRNPSPRSKGSMVPRSYLNTFFPILGLKVGRAWTRRKAIQEASGGFVRVSR